MSLDFAIPDNVWSTAVAIDVLPGIDFGVGWGAGMTWMFGED